jgi:hypothetical protein
VGTKPSKIDWTEIFQASDNVDGEYELKQEKGKILLKPENVSDGEEAEFVEGRVEIDYSAVDFDTVGKYEDALIMKVTDSSGNVGTKKVTVYIYNDKNTTPPTLVLKDEYDPLELDVDTSTVDWAGKFVEEASDVNGIDLSAYVSADVRELDVTKQGTYPVTIYVEDFAGNRTERSIKVKIEKK